MRSNTVKKFITLILVAIIGLSLVSCGSTYEKIYNQLIEEIPSGIDYPKSQIPTILTAYEEAYGLKGNVYDA